MAHVLACQRISIEDCPAKIPVKFFETLEQNQLLAHCCRHPENHDIEAWFSNEEEKAPDIYILHCTCGKKHTRFMAGGGDKRPFWEVR